MKLAASAWLLVLLLLGARPAAGAEPPPARGAVYRDRVEAHWFAAGNQFWYRIATGENRHEFIKVDAQQGLRQPAFDHARLATTLATQLGKPVDAERLPLETIEPSDDGKSVQLEGPDGHWRCDLSDYSLQEVKSEASAKPGTYRGRRERPPAPEPAAKSPDGQWAAVVHGHNLFVRDLKAGTEKALSYDATPTDTYARDSERARSVEMEYGTRELETPFPDVVWSPDSRWLVAMKTRAGTQRRVYLVESSPKDQLQPRLDSYPYLKPGDDIPVSKPHLFEVASGKETPIDDTLFHNPWSIGEVRWSSDSSRFTFLFNQRGHQVLRINSVEARGGEVRAVVEEKAATFVDYAGKSFSEYLDKSDEIIWMSERDGWNHLYLYDARTGAVKNQITKGEWVVRGVEWVDPVKRQVWFRAGGLQPGEDPYHLHNCRVNFDGSGFWPAV